MIGVRAVRRSSRSRLTSSSPFIAGMFTSVTTRSGAPLLSMLKGFTPFETASTLFRASTDRRAKLADRVFVVDAQDLFPAMAFLSAFHPPLYSPQCVVPKRLCFLEHGINLGDPYRPSRARLLSRNLLGSACSSQWSAAAGTYFYAGAARNSPPSDVVMVDVLVRRVTSSRDRARLERCEGLPARRRPPPRTLSMTRAAPPA